MKKYSNKHIKHSLSKSKKEIRKRERKNRKKLRKRRKRIEWNKKSNKSIRAAKQRVTKTWADYIPPVSALGDLEVIGNEKNIGPIPYCVFPIISMQNINKRDEKYYKCEGTGFFIHKSGVFVTAKHVPIYDGDKIEPLIAIHSHGKFVSVRMVEKYWINEDSDVAVGILDARDKRNKLVYSQDMPHPHLIPNYGNFKQDQVVKNFGYGASEIKDTDKRFQSGEFNNQWDEGEILEIHPEGRGSWTKTGPEIVGQYDTIGLASGGPVFNVDGEVVGVNSKSMPGYVEGENPTSVFTPLSEILNIEIDHPKYGKIKIKDLP